MKKIKLEKKGLYILLILSLLLPFLMPASLSADVNAKSLYDSVYTITFDSQGGSYISPAYVPYASSMSYNPIPTRENYKFMGWYTSDSFTTEFIPSTVIFENMILYAKWEYYMPSGPTKDTGWTDILRQIPQLTPGEKLNIEMNTPILPESVLKAAKGMDITLVLNFTYYSWTIHGTDITDTAPVNFSISLNQLLYTSFESDYHLLDTSNDLMLELNLANESDLPENSELNLFINSDYEDSYGNLYYLNEGISKYQYQKSNLINKKGFLSVKMNKVSTYVILITDFIPQKLEAANTLDPAVDKAFTISRNSNFNLKSKVKNIEDAVAVAFTTYDTDVARVSFYKGIVTPVSPGRVTVYIQVEYENNTKFLSTVITVK